MDVFHLTDVSITVVELSFHTHVCISFLFLSCLTWFQREDLVETLHLSANDFCNLIAYSVLPLSTWELKEPWSSCFSFMWHSSLDCVRDNTLLEPLLHCLRGWTSRRHNPYSWQRNKLLVAYYHTLSELFVYGWGTLPKQFPAWPANSREGCALRLNLIQGLLQWMNVLPWWALDKIHETILFSFL